MTRLEQRIDVMVKNKEINFEIPIYNVDDLKIYSIETLIVSHYMMDIEFYLHLKEPYLNVISTQNMKVPRFKLSENLRDIEKGVINSDMLPFDSSFKFYNPSKINVYDEIVSFFKYIIRLFFAFLTFNQFFIIKYIFAYYY